MVDPIRVVSRLKNNRLLEYREQMEWSAKATAEKIGLSYTTYLNLEGLRYFPSESLARKVADFWGVSPDEIFPSYFASISRTCASRTIPEAQLLSLSGMNPELLLTDGGIAEIEERITMDSLRSGVAELIVMLSPREQEIVRLRLGLNDEQGSYMLKEIGDFFDISVERARQIFYKAMRKLIRHGSTPQDLRHFLECELSRVCRPRQEGFSTADYEEQL